MKIIRSALILALLLPAATMAQPPQSSGLKERVESLEQRLQSTTEQVEKLSDELMETQRQLAELQGNSALQLDGLVALRFDTNGNPTVVLSGVNVQIVNGSGATDLSNEVGNLIVGYNNSVSASVNREGSHNLVLGDQQSYPETAQLVTDSVSGNQLVIRALQSATLVSGAAFHQLQKDGTVSVDGKDINIKGSGEISIKASGDLVLKGARILQN